MLAFQDINMRMKTFLEFYQQDLVERQIQYGKNAKYGQIVFFAGGAASGKGFSIANFIDADKFRIRDVDALKLMMLKMPSIRAKYPEIADFDETSLKDPEKVFLLHSIAEKEKIPERQLKNWIMGMSTPETLPNILFDTTMKNLDNINTYIPQLLSVGYKPENIHITWVLTDFEVAIVRNSERPRVVPELIMKSSHTGAAITMASLLKGNLPKSINGSITIILNNPENVTYYDKTVPQKSKDGEIIKQLRVVKDFEYVTVKQAGKPMVSFQEMDRQLKEKILTWVLANAPKNSDVWNAWDPNERIR